MAELTEFGRAKILLPTTNIITTAVTGSTTNSVVLKDMDGCNAAVFFGRFIYGSGGTTAKFWVQTSVDRGTTWCDVVSFAFTTASASKFASVISAGVVPVAPTDGTLADNTKNDGFLGTQWRVKYTTTGTYAGSTAAEISIICKA